MTVEKLQYILHGGNISRRFVDGFADEFEKANQGIRPREYEFLYTGLILQRNAMIKSTADIRRLIGRRLDMWQRDELNQLLKEAKRCANQIKPKHGIMTKEHEFRIFKR